MRLRTLTAGPAVGSIAELRKQLELGDDTSHDSHLERLLDSATRQIERHTRRAITRSKFEWTTSGRSDSTALPRPPLASIESVEIKVVTEAGWETLHSSDYTIDDTMEPFVVHLPPHHIASRIIYWAGPEPDAPADPEILQAVLQLATFDFSHRGDTSSGGAIGTGWPVALKGLIDSLKFGTVAGFYR